MDALLVNSLFDNTTHYEVEWNLYRNQYKNLKILKEFGEVQNPNISLIDPELVRLQAELFDKIKKYPITPVYNKTFNDINPFNKFLDYRSEDLNGTYYTMASIHARQNLCPMGAKVITNDIRPINFYDKIINADVYYMKTGESSTSELSFDSQLYNAYTKLYPGFESSYTPVAIINFDWDSYFDAETLDDCDLIVLRESSEGRDQNRNLKNRGPFLEGKDQYYKQEVFEGMINYIEKLKDGGNAVLQFVSLGSQHVADMIFFYSRIFESVELFIPMASDFLSMEHFLIARGFKKDIYNEMLFDVVDDWDSSKSPYYPRFTNFEDDQNFIEWLIGMNNRMMNYHLSLMMAFLQGLVDRFKNNYPLVVFPYTIDPYKLKLNLGLIKSQKIATHRINGVFEPLPNFDLISTTEELTKTQQLLDVSSFPNELKMKDGMSYQFCLYLAFQEIIKTININLPNFKNETNIISSWLLDLQYSGLLNLILNSSSPELMRQHYKNWRYEDFYSMKEFSSPIIDQGFLDNVFQALKNSINNYVSNKNNVLSMMKFKMFKTKNFKYRVQYSFTGKSYLLKSANDSGLHITQKQLLGVIPSYYKNEKGFSLNDLDNWMNDEGFVLRVLNYLSIPIFSSDYDNYVIFSDFINSNSIDFDFFGSPWHKNGIYWSSPWQENVELGALLESDAFNANHNFYNEHPEIKSFWFFPPQHIDIFSAKMKMLSNFLKGRIENGKRDTVYIVLKKESPEMEDECTDLINDLLQDGNQLNTDFVKYAVSNKMIQTEKYSAHRYKFCKIEIV